MRLRTEEELWRAYYAQKQAIQTSALAYDGGNKGEAARIANSIFVMIGRRGKRHKPILDQLGILDKIDFRTTVFDDSMSPLIQVNAFKASDKGDISDWEIEYKPREYSATFTGRLLSYNEWWNETVLSDGANGKLTRKDLIEAMRDQEGGAHFDDKITEVNYIAAVQGSFGGVRFQTEDGTPIPVLYAVEATMRQIAEEVLKTLRPINPSWVKRSSAAP